MARHLKLSLGSKPALSITRRALDAHKLVYIARAAKAQRYGGARSRIVYIGTTRKGAQRVATSAANKAPHLLKRWGLRQLDFYVVRPGKIQKVKSWVELERDLLITFKILFGRLPLGNTQGKNLSYHQLSRYFTERRLRAVIEKYS